MKMQRLCAGVSVLALSILVCAGCNRKLKPETPGTVHRAGDLVARVNAHTMTWDETDKRARLSLKDEADAKHLVIPADREDEVLQVFRRRVVMQFVNRMLLFDEAKRLDVKLSDLDRNNAVAQVEGFLKQRGISSLEAFIKQSPLGEKTMRAEIEENLLIDKFIDQEVRAKVVIRDADRDVLSSDIAAKRQLAKKKIDTLRAQLLKGGDFAALARDNSDDETKRSGGDIGEFPRGRMEKSFEDAAFGQKINEIGQVVETRFGYHIIKVTAHTAAKAATASAPATPETVRASHIFVAAPPLLTGKDITAVIQRQKMEEGLKGVVDGLRAKAKIETIYKSGPNPLPF